MNSDNALSDSWEKILFLLLGWLLGLLGPIVVDAIRRKHESKELKQAILAELHQLQYKLSGTAYLTSLQTDQYDRQFVEWYKRIVSSYRGPLTSGPLPQAIDATLARTDQEIAEAGRRLKNPPGVSLGLKSFEAPLLKSKIGQLGSYSIPFQNVLLEILSRIRIVNEEIEQFRFYFRQTLTANGENRDLIDGNIDGSYRAIRTQVMMISDHIDEAAMEENKPWMRWSWPKR
ncbi:hypothetical protein [[Pseudomonas] boreopolis]|uniref:hypothetical protein n=1 Tax=Xanthomonas boreopolis TaxID=86183 RepID=UPI003D4E9244